VALQVGLASVMAEPDGEADIQKEALLVEQRAPIPGHS
jgi:hypothetical protein